MASSGKGPKAVKATSDSYNRYPGTAEYWANKPYEFLQFVETLKEDDKRDIESAIQKVTGFTKTKLKSAVTNFKAFAKGLNGVEEFLITPPILLNRHLIIVYFLVHIMQVFQYYEIKIYGNLTRAKHIYENVFPDEIPAPEAKVAVLKQLFNQMPVKRGLLYVLERGRNSIPISNGEKYFIWHHVHHLCEVFSDKETHHRLSLKMSLAKPPDSELMRLYRKLMDRDEPFNEVHQINEGDHQHLTGADLDWSTVYGKEPPYGSEYDGLSTFIFDLTSDRRAQENSTDDEEDDELSKRLLTSIQKRLKSHVKPVTSDGTKKLPDRNSNQSTIQLGSPKRKRILRRLVSSSEEEGAQGLSNDDDEDNIKNLRRRVVDTQVTDGEHSRKVHKRASKPTGMKPSPKKDKISSKRPAADKESDRTLRDKEMGKLKDDSDFRRDLVKFLDKPSTSAVLLPVTTKRPRLETNGTISPSLLDSKSSDLRYFGLDVDNGVEPSPQVEVTATARPILPSKTYSRSSKRPERGTDMQVDERQKEGTLKRARPSSPSTSISGKKQKMSPASAIDKELDNQGTQKKNARS